MAPYPPGYQPVSFRYDLADAAVQACSRAATALHQATADRHDRAAVAQAEWRGSFRADFDRDLGALAEAARDLEDRLRQLAGTIGDAIEAASLENQRRAELRTEWDRRHPPETIPGGDRLRVA